MRKIDNLRESVKDEMREDIIKEGLNEEKRQLMDSMRESVCIELENMLKPVVEQRIVTETQEKVTSMAQKEVETMLAKRKKELEQD